MKKLMMLLVLAVTLFTACKHCCKDSENCSSGAQAVGPDEMATYKQVFVFYCDYQNTKKDHYIRVADGNVVHLIGPKTVISVDRGTRGNLMQYKTITTNFEFWEVAKGAKPDESKPDETLTDKTSVSKLIESGSKSLIYVVSLNPLPGDKNVINPPINPIGPGGPIGVVK